jgi:hypothetical protein
VLLRRRRRWGLRLRLEGGGLAMEMEVGMVLRGSRGVSAA